MAKDNKFKQTIYVKIEKDGDLSYPVADFDISNLAEIAATVRVARYDLVSEHDLTLTPKLTSR